MSIEKLTLTTPDFTDEAAARIAELFPNVVTEGRDEDGTPRRMIDFDLLKQELSADIVEGPAERYHLNWPGKRAALREANRPIDKTLRPVRSESVGFDTTRNLFIEGDNLDALKLLQETYLGKVKMIYIDPPYNTGKDFIYKDNFTGDKGEHLEASGQVDEDGGKLVANPESHGRYHSDWLSMMYPRLKLARNLLREDGVIFISIDDNEQAALKKICDEIFGEDNFLGPILWKKKTNGNNTGHIPPVHDYFLVYGKHESTEPIKGFLPTPEYYETTYSNPDNDPRGPWTTTDLSANHEGPLFPIANPNTGEVYMPAEGRYWVFNERDVLKRIADGRIIFGKTGMAGPIQKKYLKERGDIRFKPESWWDAHGYNSDGSKEIADLLAPKIFDHPKPSITIAKLVEISTDEGDMILDFFGGSGTTAHAVFTQQEKDGKTRNFCIVQIAEKSDEKSIARKQGFKTVSDLTKERIRRAGAKILAENPDLKGKLDVGFRVLKIDSSNLKDVRRTAGQTAQADLVDLVENIKPDRTGEDLLFQVMLNWGVDLCLPITRETLAGKAVYFVAGDALAGYFAKPEEGGAVDEALIKALAARAPLRAVFRDDAFADDAMRINAEQLFKQLSPRTELRVI